MTSSPAAGPWKMKNMTHAQKITAIPFLVFIFLFLLI
jgi:hypothetical protein